MATTSVSPLPAPSRRWQLAVFPSVGLLVGLADAVLLRALGISFTINGGDATWVVGVYFGVSFAILGWLLALLLAARNRARHAGAVIRLQADQLDAARRRLSETDKLAALGQLSAAIAHEVRNPLGVIRSAAQSLSESEVERTDQSTLARQEVRRAAEFIVSETDRLNGVVSSLLAFARPLQIQRRRAEVGDIIQRAVLLVRDEIGQKQVQLTSSAGEALPVLDADPDLLTQALFGLLHNAVESVPAGGSIRLAAEKRDDSLVIAVSDDGPGVPPEIRGRIFEPFFTTRPQGTGLGLATVRQIVEAHRGRVSVADTHGGGACFVMQLPFVSAAC